MFWSAPCLVRSDPLSVGPIDSFDAPLVAPQSFDWYTVLLRCPVLQINPFNVVSTFTFVDIGPIPSELGMLHRLENLGLYENQLTGAHRRVLYAYCYCVVNSSSD